VNPTVKKWASIGERLLKAFVVAFVGVYVAGGLSVATFADASVLEKAADAGLAALGSLILSLLGTNVGNKATPSLLPAKLDPTTNTWDATPPMVDPHMGLSIQGPAGGWPDPEPWNNWTWEGAPGTETNVFDATGQNPLPAGIRPKALGRRKPSNKPALQFADHLISIPAHPITDVAPDLSWPMDHNDTVGCCVVAGLDHTLQAIYTQLTGAYRNWSDGQMLAYYQTQNPDFHSWSQGGSSADGGMDIQTFLNYLVKQGVILGFAKVDHTNLEMVKAATYLGLGLVTGEILTRKNMSEQVWDYHSGDPEEGGHCTVSVGYNPLGQQVSWGDLYSMTDAFYEKRVEEAWFVITQAHVDHPAFRAGFDLTSFAAAYKQITGRDMPISLPPSPAPTPTPVGDPFLLAVAAHAGLLEKLQKNAPSHLVNGNPATIYQWAAQKLATDYKLK
jgi:hypothetical protein